MLVTSRTYIHTTEIAAVMPPPTDTDPEATLRTLIGPTKARKQTIYEMNEFVLLTIT